jgi:nucleoside-diphosphate-sugar epimerase
MHVFVTGATGFIGFHTVMALHAAGHSIRFGVRNAQKMKALYKPYGIDTSDFAMHKK